MPSEDTAVQLLITVLLVVLLGIYAGATTLFTAWHRLPGEGIGEPRLVLSISTRTSLVFFRSSIQPWTRTGGRLCGTPRETCSARFRSAPSDCSLS